MHNTNYYDIESLPNLWSNTRYQPADHAGKPGRVDIYLQLDVSDKMFNLAKHLGYVDTKDLIKQLNTPESPRPEVNVIRQTIMQVNRTFADTHPFILKFHYVDALLYELDQLINQYNHNSAQKNRPRTNWFGFNSKSFDVTYLAHMIYCYGKVDDRRKLLLADRLRFEVSDRLINNRFGQIDVLTDRVDRYNPNDTGKKNYDDLIASGNWLDTMLINEKMKHVSLKRLSGQAGYQIRESDRLDGNKPLVTATSLADLLAYNLSDVVNTYQLQQRPEYIEPLAQHQKLIKRFPEHYKHNGRRNVIGDTTSAKLVEYVISPDTTNPMSGTDVDYIDFYFPTVDSRFKTWITGFHRDYATDIKAAINDGDTDNEMAIYTKYLRLYLVNKYATDSTVIPTDFRYNPATKQIEQNLLEVFHRNGHLPDSAYEFYRHYETQQIHIGSTEPKAEIDVLRKKFPSSSHFVGTSNAYIKFSIGGAHGEYADRAAFKRDQAAAKAVYDQQVAIQDWFIANARQHMTLADLNAQDEAATDAGAIATAALNARLTRRNGLPDDYPRNLSQTPWTITTGTYAKAKFKALPKVLDETNSKDIKEYAKTVFVSNCIHADVDSLYPSLLSILKVFENAFTNTLDKTTIPQGYSDLYAGIRAERLRLKRALPKIKDRSQWTEQALIDDDIQKLYKLLLNAASGAADARFTNNIQMPHKIIKMRICGQLIIADLAYRITEAGGTVVSTNTDGIYLTGIPFAHAEAIINEWKTWLGLSAAPETIGTFISKDSNNRIELTTDGNVISAAGGTIGSYKGIGLHNNVAKPTVVDLTLVNYLRGKINQKANPLLVFDRNAVLAYLKTLQRYTASLPTDRPIVNHNGAIPSLDEIINLRSYWQWIFASNRTKHRYYVPLSATPKIQVDGSLAPNVATGLDAAPEYRSISKQMVNRTFLIKPSIYNVDSEFDPVLLHQHTLSMRLLTINKTNKYKKITARTNPAEKQLINDTHELANSMQRDFGLSDLAVDESVTAKPMKINGLDDDNFMYLSNDALSTLPAEFFNYLDVEAYCDLIEQQWHAWADQHAILGDGITNPIADQTQQPLSVL